MNLFVKKKKQKTTPTKPNTNKRYFAPFPPHSSIPSVSAFSFGTCLEFNCLRISIGVIHTSITCSRSYSRPMSYIKHSTKITRHRPNRLLPLYLQLLLLFRECPLQLFHLLLLMLLFYAQLVLQLL